MACAAAPFSPQCIASASGYTFACVSTCFTANPSCANRCAPGFECVADTAVYGANGACSYASCGTPCAASYSSQGYAQAYTCARSSGGAAALPPSADANATALCFDVAECGSCAASEVCAPAPPGVCGYATPPSPAGAPQSGLAPPSPEPSPANGTAPPSPAPVPAGGIAPPSPAFGLTPPAPPYPPPVLQDSRAPPFPPASANAPPPPPASSTYQGFASPLGGVCSDTTPDNSAATVDGGVFVYNSYDSYACVAWKLAATVCTQPPVVYPANATQLANWKCAPSGSVGGFCTLPEQRVCSTCVSGCSANCGGGSSLGPLTMLDCSGAEAAQSAPNANNALPGRRLLSDGGGGGGGGGGGARGLSQLSSSPSASQFHVCLRRPAAALAAPACFADAYCGDAGCGDGFACAFAGASGCASTNATAAFACVPSTTSAAPVFGETCFAASDCDGACGAFSSACSLAWKPASSSTITSGSIINSGATRCSSALPFACSQVCAAPWDSTCGGLCGATAGATCGTDAASPCAGGNPYATFYTCSSPDTCWPSSDCGGACAGGTVCGQAPSGHACGGYQCHAAGSCFSGVNNGGDQCLGLCPAASACKNFNSGSAISSASATPNPCSASPSPINYGYYCEAVDPADCVTDASCRQACAPGTACTPVAAGAAPPGFVNNTNNFCAANGGWSNRREATRGAARGARTDARTIFCSHHSLR